MNRRWDSNIRRIHRWLTALGNLGAVMLVAAPAVQADPAAGPPDPFPDYKHIVRYYHEVKYDDYFTGSSGGVWFSTPLGLNCGIWDRGSFGCTGDIRGAPPGTTNIGWVNGNIVTRYDWLLGVQFPPGRAERDLPPSSYINYNGTVCATMADTSTYCRRGPYKFLVTQTRSWLAPP